MTIKEKIEAAAKKADSQLDMKSLIKGIKGIALEIFDGPLINGGLEFAYAKLPESVHDEFELCLDCYLSDDAKALTPQVVEKLNAAINIPGLSEEKENIIFKHVFQAFVELTTEPGQGPTDPDPDK